MASWKRDFGSGLIVVVPVLVTAYVIAWIYGFVADITPQRLITPMLMRELGVPVQYTEIIRVLVAAAVFVVFVFAVGYLVRTAVGDLFERFLDDVFNRLPGLRVVYNASKMAAETALGGTDSLQEPCKIETWQGLRMTAFKTGKQTDDGREVIFLPTAPNITTGFVIEVDPERVESSDESVEDALTRVLSAGFGDSDRGQVSVEDLVEGTPEGEGTEAATED
jgi:uncharacterized membrane protein